MVTQSHPGKLPCCFSHPCGCNQPNRPTVLPGTSSVLRSNLQACDEVREIRSPDFNYTTIFSSKIVIFSTNLLVIVSLYSVMTWGISSRRLIVSFMHMSNDTAAPKCPHQGIINLDIVVIFFAITFDDQNQKTSFLLLFAQSLFRSAFQIFFQIVTNNQFSIFQRLIVEGR